MTEKNEPQQTENEFQYSNHFLAFLDLLGQKEELVKIEGIIAPPRTETKNAILLNTLRATVGRIWKFRKFFSEFLKQFIEHPLENNISKAFEPLILKMRGRSKINFQSFSDSIIIWTPIHLREDHEVANVLNSINGILGSIAMIVPYYLSQKIPIRGGIDIEGGIAIEPDGNELYGPVLNRAYILESKCAEYPRVLVGKGLIDFLNYCEKIELKDKLIERYCHSASLECKKWIIADEDGREMIHFLGPHAIALIHGLPDVDFYKDIITPIEVFINESLEKFKDNPTLFERYTRLKKYFDLNNAHWK